MSFQPKYDQFNRRVIRPLPNFGPIDTTKIPKGVVTDHVVQENKQTISDNGAGAAALVPVVIVVALAYFYLKRK